jgi:hypothetical protein
LGTLARGDIVCYERTDWKTAMKMKPEHLEILRETLCRTKELEMAEPNNWYEQVQWLWQAEHGICFSLGEWFGVASNDAGTRMRYGRALRELEDAGLVELYRPGLLTVRAVRLTTEERTVAEALARLADGDAPKAHRPAIAQ